MREKIESILTLFGIFILMEIVMGFPTMFLWNILMPEIFGITKISLYQAIGINFLSMILFKSNINIKKV